MSYEASLWQEGPKVEIQERIMKRGKLMIEIGQRLILRKIYTALLVMWIRLGIKRVKIGHARIISNNENATKMGEEENIESTCQTIWSRRNKDEKIQEMGKVSWRERLIDGGHTMWKPQIPIKHLENSGGR